MKDTLTQMGLVILGVFIVVTVVLGSTGSFKEKTTAVGTNTNTEIQKSVDHFKNTK